MADSSPRRRGAQPTQADIAARLNVTDAAVGLALNGRPGVSEKLRKEVRRVAAEIGYEPNYVARAMRTNKSFTLGIVYRNLHNPAFLSLIEGFDEVCNENGYTVMVCSSRFSEAREVELIRSLAGKGIDGLAVMAFDEQAAESAWRRFGSKPLAFLASSSVRPDSNSISVRPEETVTIRRSVDLLADLGHRRIALLVGSMEHPSGEPRTEAFLAAARSRGVDPVLLPAGWDRAFVQKSVAIHLGLPERATAFVANSDYLAAAVYLAARDCGLRVPEDVSVVGHDDIDLAELLDPPLTTFRVDHFQMGSLAARELIRGVEGNCRSGKEIVIPTILVRRGSTAAPRVD